MGSYDDAALGLNDTVSDLFYYIYSCDLNENVQIKIGTLEGNRKQPTLKELVDDPLLKFSGVTKGSSGLYLRCQVFSESFALTLPVRTAHKPFTNRWSWNEWLTLPIKYSDLPRDALLAITILDVYSPKEDAIVGGTSISLFGRSGNFRQGLHDLRVWPGVSADGNSSSSTPGKGKIENCSGETEGAELTRLASLTKDYRNGNMAKVDWLDRLTFREIEQINDREKRSSSFLHLSLEFSRVHFEGTDFTVVYFEKNGDEARHFQAHSELVTISDPEIGLPNLVEAKHHALARPFRDTPTDRDLKPNAAVRDQLNTISGYPPSRLLTSEEKDLLWKYRFFLTSQKKALTKFLKCVNWDVEKEEKQALELLEKWIPVDVDDALELLSSNPNFKHPTVRTYGVTRLKQASDEDLVLYLLQLVQALKYENHREILQDRSMDLQASDSSITNAIEPELRQRKAGSGGAAAAAVTLTERKNTKDEKRGKARVANLRTEETSSLLRSSGTDDEDEDDENEETLEVGGRARVAGEVELDAAPDMAMSMADAMEDLEDSGTLDEKTISVGGIGGDGATGGAEALKPGLVNAELESSSSSSHLGSSLHSGNVDTKLQKQHESRFDAPIDLATFLIFRACNNFELASNLYWYLMVECEDDGTPTASKVGNTSKTSHKDMYSAVIRRLLTELRLMGPKGIEYRELLTRQEKFVDDLVKLVKAVASEKADRPKKIERLQTMLSESKDFDFSRIRGLPLPLDPNVRILSVIAEKAYVFKSALQPCKLVFKTVVDINHLDPASSSFVENLVDNNASSGLPALPPPQPSLPTQAFGEYQCIFKNGDDLRQDQLVLQIIQLMDNLLRRENLDLKLTPYKALASSSRHGFAQFIPSITVGAALREHGNSILNYFRIHAPEVGAPFGIQPEVMDNYVKSCAGYCIITYILGVGDRHNDNLLLTTNGKLFHVDFGFILGRDPKPLPPQMKLSKEMVEAMGGYTSEYFQTFKKHCYAAYLHLRRNSNLILNLFSLMLEANIPDIALEPDKTVGKVHDKFKLELNDEQAIQFLHFVIDNSIKAFFPVVIEKFHSLAAYFKA